MKDKILEIIRDHGFDYLRCEAEIEELYRVKEPIAVIDIEEPKKKAAPKKAAKKK